MVLPIKINYYCFLQVQQQSILQWQMFHNTIHKGHHLWPWTVATIAFKGQQQLDLVVPIMVVVAHYNCKALIVQWVPTSENWSFENCQNNSLLHTGQDRACKFRSDFLVKLRIFFWWFAKVCEVYATNLIIYQWFHEKSWLEFMESFSPSVRSLAALEIDLKKKLFLKRKYAKYQRRLQTKNPSRQMLNLIKALALYHLFFCDLPLFFAKSTINLHTRIWYEKYYPFFGQTEINLFSSWPIIMKRNAPIYDEI